MPANVLCVDDDRSLCQIVSRALQSEGHSVRSAHDGQAALDAIQEECPQMVLLDLVLPRRDGFEVLEAIRAMPSPASDLPVVLVSGATPTKASRQRARRLGASDFLTKPVSLERLLSVVAEHAGELKRRRRGPTPVVETPTRAKTGKIAGDLERIPFPAVLHHLHGMRATGVLHLRSSTRKRKAVGIREGYPIAVKSNLKSETLGDFLERKGRITHAIYEESLSLLTGGRRQGEVLVAMDVLSEEEVAEVLLEQADAKFFEIFRWPRGVFHFERGATLGRANSLGLGRSPASLIVEGVRSHFPLKRIDRYLSQQGQRLVRHADSPFYRFQELHLDPSQETILRNLDGTRRLGEFRTENEEFRRTLYGMVAAGLLELSSRVNLPKTKARPTPRRSRVEERSAATAADRRRDGATQVELQAMAEQLRAKTHFEILGIGEGTNGDTLSEAYAGLSSNLHPDRYVGESQGVRELASELHQLVQDAYSTLSDPKERKKYVLGRRQERQAEERRRQSEKALEAEIAFRKGEGSLRIHDYPGALAHFGRALELYPEEGDHHAHYGWTLYLCHPGQPSIVGEALEHVKRGVKLASHREKPYLFMGRLYKVVGRIDAAEKMFTRAVQIQPECVEALRELRLINLRRERSKGFIGRLFRR
jgi:CheY-like chemotaxis protein/tetratricopeptide (TPR) repeat protein